MNENKKLMITTTIILILAILAIGGIFAFGWHIIEPLLTPEYIEPLPQAHGTPAVAMPTATPWPEFEPPILAVIEEIKTAAIGTLTSPVAHVATTALNVRNGPGFEYDRVAVLAKGSRLMIYTCDSGWARLTVKGNRHELWVNADYLTSEPCLLINTRLFDFDVGQIPPGAE